MQMRERVVTNLYGVGVLTFFAGLWAFVGFIPYQPVIAAVTMAATLAMVGGVGWKIARVTAERSDGAASPARGAGRNRRGFWVVFAAEMVLIFVAVNVCISTGHPSLQLPAIAAIVGLHFLPLARIFQIPSYFVTGFALTLFAIAMLLAGWRGFDIWMQTGIGAAIIIGATALHRFSSAQTLAGRSA